jgi:hypothetical protein
MISCYQIEDGEVRFVKEGFFVSNLKQQQDPGYHLLFVILHR